MPVLALSLGCLLLLLAPADPQVARAPAAAAASELTDLADLARLGVADRPREIGTRPVRDAEPALFVVEAAAHSRQAFLLPGGPRTLRELVVEPTPATVEAWRSARLRLVWESDDPDAGAAVDLPLGLLFGRFAPDAGLNATLLADSAGPVWVCRFPMPYRAQALLDMATERPLEGRIRLRTTAGVAPGAGYFRAASWSGPAQFSDTGRGHLAGVLVVEERESVRLEADEGRLMLDDRDRGPLATALRLPGATDGAVAPAPAAATGRARAGPGGPSAAFRWLAADPLPYDRGMALRSVPGRDAVNRAGVGNGGENGGTAAVRVAVFWYSDRPRAGATSATAVGSDPGHRGR